MSPKGAARVHQVFRWLKAAHPSGRRCRLRVDRRLKYHGYVTGPFDSIFYIYICRKDTKAVGIDTLLHEYAHLIVHPDDEHSTGWAKCYAHIYASFVDGPGMKESRLY